MKVAYLFVTSGHTVDYKLGGSLGGLFRGVGSALWPIFNREVQGMTDDSLHRLGGFFD